MILSDVTIAEYVADYRMIDPFDPAQLNSASYDLTIGDSLIVEYEDGSRTPSMPLYANGYNLAPGELVLASSKERFNLPDNVCAFVKLKSSRAREGWNHLMAGWCDPGWHGSVLTMELTNCNRFKELWLYPGLKMVQMVFMFVDRPVGQLYAGKYNNDETVEASKDSTDPTVLGSM